MVSGLDLCQVFMTLTLGKDPSTSSYDKAMFPGDRW
jgi:hypothetical protein